MDVTGLQNGTPLPTIELAAIGDGALSLPGDLSGNWGVVLGYRGLWCPWCNEQLASFQRDAALFETLGITVAAFSVDGESDAKEMVDRHGITFKVGYGADGAKVAEVFGCYLHPTRGSLEPMGFVLRPDSTIALAAYSSGVIGRLMPHDVLRMVRNLQRRA